MRISITTQKSNKTSSIITFLVCILSIVIAFLSHYTGFSLLMLLSIAIMSGGILFLSGDKKLPILFSALPWMEVLKINSSQPTLFHMLYFVFIIVLLKDIKKVNIKPVLLVLLFIIYVFIVRLITQSDFEYGYIAYIMGIVFMTLLFPNLEKYYNPILCTNMFSFGLITAFIAERIYRDMPSMLIYLSSDTYASDISAIRYAGLYNDSNFMSMLVLMYICLLLNIFQNMYLTSMKKITLLLPAIIITLFTFFSVSKMFYLGLVIITVYYIFSNLKKIKIKTILKSLILGGLLITISYKLGFFDGIFYRLESTTNLDSLTTGRSSIISNYLSMFFSEGTVTLFGIGMNDRLYYQGISTHNTLITAIYQLGIVGLFFIYIPMIIVIIRSATVGIQQYNKKLNYLAVIVLGLCMVSLDVLMYEGLSILILITINTLQLFKMDERVDSYA